MIPSVWSFSPDAAKDAWRGWVRRTKMTNTSEAFMAGALWALSQAGQQALRDEIAALQKTVQALKSKVGND